MFVILGMIFFISHCHLTNRPYLIFPLVYIANLSIDFCHVRSMLPLHSHLPEDQWFSKLLPRTPRIPLFISTIVIKFQYILFKAFVGIKSQKSIRSDRLLVGTPVFQPVFTNPFTALKPEYSLYNLHWIGYFLNKTFKWLLININK